MIRQCSVIQRQVATGTRYDCFYFTILEQRFNLKSTRRQQQQQSFTTAIASSFLSNRGSTDAGINGVVKGNIPISGTGIAENQYAEVCVC